MTLSVHTIFAQSANIKLLPPNQDYSTYFLEDKSKSFTLSNIILDKEFTAIQVTYTIKNNQMGSFTFGENNFYISGEWGICYPYGLYLGDKQWQLGKRFDYDYSNKGKSIICTFLFERIPAGFPQINICSDGEIVWADIPIDNPSEVTNSKWTEKTLKDYWKTNKAEQIEGIYTFVDTDDKEWWGNTKHTVAILKDDYDEYNIIYLAGGDGKIWKVGEVKAHIVPTAVNGLYKVSWWYMENKIANENFYMRFDETSFLIYENDSSITANFLKLYPSFNQLQNSSRSSSASSTQIHNGSGVVISKDGIIATNYHVVSNANKIEVLVNNKSKIETYTAKVLCVDKANDLALLQIDITGNNLFEVPPYVISPKSVDVGMSIFTMGYPVVDYLGEEVKITDGLISSKTGYEGDIATYQISAPIHPGNSGGPLFDKNGYLVGITNAGIPGAQNVGYAIKSSYLLNLIESAPIQVEYPTTNKLNGLGLPEQIKILSQYVVFIKTN